jgi:mannose-6-phosphate isomerase-like protein (cupin superfamily)
MTKAATSKKSRAKRITKAKQTAKAKRATNAKRTTSRQRTIRAKRTTGTTKKAATRLKVRRVVTGHNATGTSVFVSDGAPPRVADIAAIPGASITAVWATDHGMTAVPGSEDPTPSMTTFVPGWGGTRFLITVFPPAGTPPANLDPQAAAADMRAQIPGLAESMEPDHPGMHTTDTVDYDIIMSGALWLELDDGAEVQLKPGDVVVQNGTRHAWRNKGSKPCVMYSVLAGVPRR